MRPAIALALVGAALLPFAFAACKGGVAWEPDPPAPPPPVPTQPAPPQDCVQLGGTCRQDACEYGECRSPEPVVCEATPTTAQCGDLNAGPYYDGPRCCVPLSVDDAGWMKLSFDPECGLSMPYREGQWPAPLQWEPCSPELTAAWPGCEWLRADWPAGQGPYEGRIMDEPQAGSFDKQTTMTRLIVSRVSGPAIYRMVVRVDDGYVETVFRETRPECSLSHADLRGAAFVFTVTRRDGEKIVKTGALRNQYEYVPYAGDTTNGGEPVHFAGGHGFFTTPTNVITKYTWADGGYVVSHDRLAVDGKLENVVFRDDVVFFAGLDADRPKIRVFAAGEVRDFLAFGDDVTSGSADFGTDGRDMVWAEASGRTAPGEPWSRIDIVTAAYTMIPELIGPTIRKRRLRSETSFGGAPFVVGCEYAAHAIGTTSVRVVRLADGRSWTLASGAADPATSWRPTSPLAVTCDEILLRLRRGDEHQVAKIPLTTLGPGEAAD